MAKAVEARTRPNTTGLTLITLTQTREKEKMEHTGFNLIKRIFHFSVVSEYFPVLRSHRREKGINVLLKLIFFLNKNLK